MEVPIVMLHLGTACAEMDSFNLHKTLKGRTIISILQIQRRKQSD